LEAHVGHSAIIPEFQGYPGNNTPAAEISFLEARQNHKEPHQWVRRMGNHSHVFAVKNCCCFCMSLINQGTSFDDIYCMFRSSLRIHWHVPCGGPKPPAIFKNVCKSVFIDKYLNWP